VGVTTSRKRIGPADDKPAAPPAPPLEAAEQDITVRLPAELVAELDRWSQVNEVTRDTLILRLERGLGRRPRKATT